MDSMELKKMSSGMSNNIHPTALTEDQKGTGCEKIEDKNELRKPNVDPNLNVYFGHENKSAISNLHFVSQEMVPMSAKAGKGSQSCILTNINKTVQDKQNEGLPKTSESINTVKTVSYGLSQPTLLEERRECIECNCDILIKHSDFHACACKNRKELDSAPFENKNDQMWQQDLHKTQEKCTGNKLNTNDESQTSHVTEYQEESNFEEWYMPPELVDDENDPYLQQQYLQILSMQFRENVTSDNSTLDNYGAASHTIPQSNTGKNCLDQNSTLEPITFETSEDSNKSEKKCSKKPKHRKSSTLRTCTLCNSSMNKMIYDSHVKLCRKIDKLHKPYVETEEKIQSQQVFYEAKTSKYNNEESHVTTGSHSRQLDWKECFTSIKKFKLDPFESTIIYEDLTLQEKSNLLAQICGVVSGISGRACINSVKCPWHGDLERYALRRSLLAVSASDTNPEHAVNPAVNMAEGTVITYCDADSTEKSSEDK